MDVRQLDQVDQSFDRYTVYPVVSSVTESARVLYGLSELITGLAMCIIGGLGQLFSDEKKYEEKFDQGFMHMFFGGANMVKGTFGAILFVNLLVAAHNNSWGERNSDALGPIWRRDWTTFSPKQQVSLI